MARILIAEDYDDLRSLLSMILENQGHNIVAVENGALALAMLASEQPVDLVVTDIELPGMSGLELLLIVKERYRKLPVVVVSAYPFPLQHASTSADAVLLKPFTMHRFISTIEKVLSDR